MKRLIVVALLVTAGFCGAAGAAEKIKPYPHYWMSVATQNQSMPGMGEGMAGIASMFGGKGPGFGPRRELLLQLESPRDISAPEAFHHIPSVMDMGEKLPLLTPRPEKRETVREERQPHEMPEKGKFRMLVYWGCGDTPGKGQPKVFDSETMSPTEIAKVFKGRSPTRQSPPAPRKGWTYGEWPHNETRKDIPRGASLLGEHRIKGNYVTDILFTLDQQRDFMAPVEFTATARTAQGGMKVDWRSIPTAMAYFATAMTHNQQTGEMIFWSSSEVQENGSALMDYLPNDDVRRFLKDKIFMEPTRTSCTVPAPVVAGGAGMLQFIAYGEELNLVYPPKPKDPKKPWDPQWSVKVRLKSTGGKMLMESDEGAAREKPARKKRSRAASDEEELGQSPPAGASERDDNKGRVMDGLRGIFGF